MSELNQSLNPISGNFLKNSKILLNGFSTIDDVMFLVKKQLEIKNELIKQHYQSEYVHLGNTITLIEKIYENPEFKERFDLIYNQSIVSLVSYFTSSIEDLFCYKLMNLASIDYKLLVKKDYKDITLDEKFNLKELALIQENRDEYVKLVFKKLKLSFQDYSSIKEAFQKYFKVSILFNDAKKGTICFAQKARHLFAHTDGKVTEEFFSSVHKLAPKKTLKIDPILNTQLQFKLEDIKETISCMLEFLNLIYGELEK